MNATMVASGTKAVPPPVSSIQDTPIAKIRESKTNPRRFFDEAKLAELADFVPGNKIRIMLLSAFCAHCLGCLGLRSGARGRGHIILRENTAISSNPVLYAIVPLNDAYPNHRRVSNRPLRRPVSFAG